MLDENLDIFTDCEFGQRAIVNGIELSGVFDDHYEQSFDSLQSAPTEGRKYCLKVQTKEVVGLNHGALVDLTDLGRTFEVVGVQPCHPDGKLTDLILKEL